MLGVAIAATLSAAMTLRRIDRTLFNGFAERMDKLEDEVKWLIRHKNPGETDDGDTS